MSPALLWGHRGAAHTRDSLLGLGRLLRLLVMGNEQVDRRVGLLEERSQLDLDLLGPGGRERSAREDVCQNTRARPLGRRPQDAHADTGRSVSVVNTCSALRTSPVDRHDLILVLFLYGPFTLSVADTVALLPLHRQRN